MNAQLKEPEIYIGGGNVAGILGVSPYKTPFAEYLGILEGRNAEVEAEKLRFFERRKALEPFAADIFTQSTGLRVIARNGRYNDPQYPFLQAEIDFETTDKDGRQNGEIKTVHPLAAAAWGPPGNDDCPVYVTAQAMHGLMITGRKRCYVQALIGFDDDRMYVVERDEAVIAGMRERELTFWRRLQDRTPPDLTDSSDVLRLFGRDAGTSIEATDEIAGVYHDLVAAREQFKDAEERKKALEERVKLFLLGNATLTVDGLPVLTWKAQTQKRLDESRLKAERPEIYDEFLHALEFRVLRIK